MLLVWLCLNYLPSLWRYSSRSPCLHPGQFYLKTLILPMGGRWARCSSQPAVHWTESDGGIVPLPPPWVKYSPVHVHILFVMGLYFYQTVYVKIDRSQLTGLKDSKVLASFQNLQLLTINSFSSILGKRKWLHLGCALDFPVLNLHLYTETWRLLERVPSFGRGLKQCAWRPTLFNEPCNEDGETFSFFYCLGTCFHSRAKINLVTIAY